MKGPLTIWPVYAYTLAAQNTVTKLSMLILYADDNSSMSYEEICSVIYIFCHHSVEIEVSVGLGSKFHEYKKVENLYFSCMVAIVVTYVRILEHSVDRKTQESCKNAPNMFKYLQYEI